MHRMSTAAGQLSPAAAGFPPSHPPIHPQPALSPTPSSATLRAFPERCKGRSVALSGVVGWSRRRRRRAGRDHGPPPPASTASRRDRPCAIHSATSAARTASSTGSRWPVAPAITTVISPRTCDSAAHAASSASVPRSTCSWVLVSSRQTAARRSPPSTSATVRERGSQPVRRLEQHERAGVDRDRAEPGTTLPRLAGQKPLEAEPVDRDAGDGDRCRDGGRAGDDGDRQAGCDRLGDQHVPRVRHQRHPGIGHDEHGAAVPRPLEQRGRRGRVRPRRTPPRPDR